MAFTSRCVKKSVIAESCSEADEVKRCCFKFIPEFDLSKDSILYPHFKKRENAEPKLFPDKLAL